jgi:hypothetical protein
LTRVQHKNSRLSGMTLFGLAIAVLLYPSGARADAMIGTENCKPITAQASVRVVTENDTVLDASIRPDIAETLRLRGHGVAENGPVSLMYRTEIRQLKDVKERSGQLIDSKVKTGEGQEVFVHLWRSHENSVLGGKRSEAPHANYATYLLLIVEISDTRDGSCLWRGRSMARLEGWRDAELAKRMIPPLLSRMGKAVERENVILE